jgi:hypothetical protein
MIARTAHTRCWPPLTHLRSALLQLRYLPHDPFEHDFKHRLDHLATFVYHLQEAPHAAVMSEHVMALGVIPAYLGRLQQLASVSFSCPFPGRASHTFQAAAASLAAPSLDVADPRNTPTSVSLEDFCSLVTHMLVRLPTTVCERSKQHGLNPSVGDEPTLLALEQLISRPGALAVAVYRGLAVEVQEAAAAGNADAGDCMDVVARLFRFTAGALFSHGILWEKDCSRVESLTAELGAFLNLEDTLPYLELLCLPQDFGKARLPRA